MSAEPAEVCRRPMTTERLQNCHGRSTFSITTRTAANSMRVCNLLYVVSLCSHARAQGAWNLLCASLSWSHAWQSLATRELLHRVEAEGSHSLLHFVGSYERSEQQQVCIVRLLADHQQGLDAGCLLKSPKDTGGRGGRPACKLLQEHSPYRSCLITSLIKKMPVFPTVYALKQLYSGKEFCRLWLGPAAFAFKSPGRRPVATFFKTQPSTGLSNAPNRRNLLLPCSGGCLSFFAL